MKLEHAIAIVPELPEWYEQAISVFVVDKERVLVIWSLSEGKTESVMKR